MSLEQNPVKITKQLRLKAQEFLNLKKNAHPLIDILKHFQNGADQQSCLLTLEYIFTTLLREKFMFITVVPLKPVEKTKDNEYKEWLRNIYEATYSKILLCLENSSHKIQTQGLSTAMNILATEGKYPLEVKESLDNYVPLPKLKLILMKLLSDKQNNSHLINKYTEYLLYDDILFFTWKLLPSLTAKSNPNDTYILNYLLLLEKLQVFQNNETKILCGNGNVPFFTFDENLTKKCLNKIWHCVTLWEHTPQTHKQMLIVLLERVLTYLDKPLLMTDFLMDSLDIGGPVSLLALQGIFTMIQVLDIEEDLTCFEQDDIISDITSRNEIDPNSMQIKHRYMNKKTKKWTMILALNKNTYEKIMYNKKMYFGSGRYRVLDDFNVNLCYNCNKYGHSSKKCKNKVCCGFCAQEHSTNSCQQKESKMCINCSQANNKYNLHLDTTHSTFDRVKCETYKHLIKRCIQVTDYPYDPNPFNQSTKEKSNKSTS